MASPDPFHPFQFRSPADPFDDEEESGLRIRPPGEAGHWVERGIDDELPPESLELDIEVQLEVVEVSVALRSEAFVWEGFDGEIGVFHPTYDDIPVGRELEVRLQLTGERPFVATARVRFTRDANDTQWPGAGLELLDPTPSMRAALDRFSRLRPPTFYAT